MSKPRRRHPHYDLNGHPTGAPRSRPLLGDSARAESPRDIYAEMPTASIGQSRRRHPMPIGRDRSLKVPTYWDYGQQPTNRSLRGFGP
ncbi:hypothetical protein EVAR_65172_1 [Eumeta japonica]|uniref:Uncharacterized protein n=1 Tax=Eumeta variegata TaxID=151549 RepID=A0A4C1ZFE1_EUMVA|nr:hypothetical protein EVAR_65172_1 [Eumeta japonica]